MNTNVALTAVAKMLKENGVKVLIETCGFFDYDKAEKYLLPYVSDIYCDIKIFDREKQDVHAGGSGCGCAASVLCSYIMSGFEKGLWEKVLFAPTGALLSPTTTQQGESIPGICHAIAIENM